MKKTISLFAVCLALTLLLGTGCDEQNGHSADTILDEQKAIETVETYMKYTLGSIPDSDVNYAKARQLVTPDLREQFENPMFVPSSYCIQDGPDDVKILSSIYKGDYNWTDVIVQANYGGEWMDMWNFKVVPIEGDQWWINEIECLN